MAKVVTKGQLQERGALIGMAAALALHGGDAHHASAGERRNRLRRLGDWREAAVKYILIAMLGSASFTATFDDRDGCKYAKAVVEEIIEWEIKDQGLRDFIRPGYDPIVCVPASDFQGRLAEQEEIVRKLRAENDARGAWQREPQVELK